jgi:peptidoglycan hydrolase-like protein with peptidoglycan-binding domain
MVPTLPPSVLPAQEMHAMSQSPNTTAAVEDSWDASGRATQVVPEQDYPAEQVTAIQLALVSMGYNLTGQSTQAQSHTEGDGVDGVWDNQTRQAVRQFQDDNDL